MSKGQTPLLVGLFLAFLAVPAAAQAEGALPPSLAESLRQAAESAEAMAGRSTFGTASERAGEASLDSAVVSAIAEHPDLVPEIVHEAVTLAPSYRSRIVETATAAYPGFAAQIAAGAGEPTPSPQEVAPALSPAPSLAEREDSPTAEPSLGEREERSHAFGITEVVVGVLAHDVGVFGRSEEEGNVDIDLGVRFEPLEGEFWELIATPRPHVGFHVNTSGETSQFFGGITWTFDLGSGFFFGSDLGLALHDGDLTTSDEGEKELGLRVLFRLGAEVGYRFSERHAVSLVLDHISNGRLAEANEGLDDFGIRYTYRM